MFRSRTGKALLAALIAATTALVSAAPQDGKFSIAVLRRDGLMIPFASFNGHTWSAPWPGAATGIPLPISIGDIPKSWWGDVAPSAPWTAWLDEGEPRPLKLVKPVQVPIFCGGHLAISTDYHGSAPPERGPTVGKDGIATAGDVTVLPITQVSVNSPDAGRLIAAVTEKFNEEEDLAASHFTHWYHPFGRNRRTHFPIELEAFYRATESTARGDYRTSYIEAVRRYPALPGDQGCGLVTFVRGWVTEFTDKKPIINIGARVTYCDRAEVSFLQPLGRINLPRAAGRDRQGGTQAYWIYQLSSWRDEFYSVAHVSTEGVKPVVVVAAGGCPKEPAR
ncbi:MAG TPA: hypothetical protein VEL51_09030 [Vicinamibacterales bacterium]|nr:hypothetical protein [Vicinamibacterales bacterium]